MPTYVEAIGNMLREGRFAEITIDQWDIILSGIAVDAIQSEAAYKGMKTPSWTSRVPNVHFSIVLGLYSRDYDEIVATTLFFEERLPTSARIVLCDALTSFVMNAYKTLKQINYDKNSEYYDQAKALVDSGLSISRLLSGAIRADVAEEIALDTKFHNRQGAVANLLGQGFRNSASPAFWKTIEGQVSWAPELVVYVMSYHLEKGNWFTALRVLKHVPNKPEGNIVRLVERALKKSRHVSGWDRNVREIFSELPPWVLKMVNESIELDPIFGITHNVLSPQGV